MTSLFEESNSGRDDLRTRVRRGDVLSGCLLNLGSAVSAEIVAVAGFDWVVIDLEHGAGTEGEMLAQLQALAGSRTAALVRVEAIERARFQRALDAGAAGVLVPRVESLSDARRATEYCRYSGSRGVARYNRAWQWGVSTKGVAKLDELTVCVLQIETLGALESVEEIAAVEGVDALFIGPADLAQALGLSGGLSNAEFASHARRIADAARTHGKAVGIHVLETDQAPAFFDLGFTLIACSSDSGLLMQRAREVAGALFAPTTGLGRVAFRQDGRR